MMPYILILVILTLLWLGAFWRIKRKQNINLLAGFLFFMFLSTFASFLVMLGINYSNRLVYLLVGVIFLFALFVLLFGVLYLNCILINKYVLSFLSKREVQSFAYFDFVGSSRDNFTDYTIIIFRLGLIHHYQLWHCGVA